MITYRPYLKYFVLTALLLSLPLAAFNFIIDPVNVYGIVNIEGFNRVKPELDKYKAIWKSSYLKKQKPKLVFFGSSRVELGINPISEIAQQHIPQDKTRFNSAIAASCIYWTMRFVQQAIDSGGTQEMVIGIDYGQCRNSARKNDLENFSNFEKVLSVDAKGNSQPFHVLDMFNHTLFSLDALDASLKTLKKQNIKYQRNSPYGHILNERFLRSILRKRSLLEYFHKEEDIIIDNHLRSTPEDYDFDRGMKCLYSIIELAKKNNIRLTLFINPTHARLQHLDLLFNSKNQPDDWKRAVVKAVKDADDSYPDTHPITVWDFSIINDMTAEPLPRDKQALMTWYFDPSHFNEKLGDLVIKVIFTGEPARTPKGQQFGFLLTEENIEDQIRMHHRSINNWKANQAEAFQELEFKIAKKKARFNNNNNLLFGKKPVSKEPTRLIGLAEAPPKKNEDIIHFRHTRQ